MLATRQFTRIGVFLALETDLLHQLAGALADLLFLFLQHQHRRHHDVLHRRLVREQIILLEHHADPLAKRQLVEIRVGQVDAANLDYAALNVVQRIDAADQGGLARSRRPDDTDNLALHYIERHALQHLQVAKIFMHIPDRDDGVLFGPFSHGCLLELDRVPAFERDGDARDRVAIDEEQDQCEGIERHQQFRVIVLGLHCLARQGDDLLDPEQ